MEKVAFDQGTESQIHEYCPPTNSLFNNPKIYAEKKTIDDILLLHKNPTPVSVFIPSHENDMKGSRLNSHLATPLVFSPSGSSEVKGVRGKSL